MPWADTQATGVRRFVGGWWHGARMDIPLVVIALVALLVGALGGALIAVAAASTGRQRLERELASTGAERDVLVSQLDGERDRFAAERAASADDRAVAAELAPLRHTLDRVAEHVNVLERDRVEQFGAVGAVLREVNERTHALGQQTATLSGALNSSGTRGHWGEVQLRRVLEHAGMLEKCDFEEQVTSVTRHEARVRPDVVVHLPGDKTLVIDAKAPLDAFLKAQGTELSPTEQNNFLQQHAAALRGHVDTLIAKSYWSAFDNSPELVICFVPSDAVLAVALQTQPELYDYAQSRKIVLASPATLLAVLRATAFAWQQDALNANAAQVLRLGTELHSRLSTMGKHVTTMGSSLRRSVDAYNQMVGAMESRVMVTSRKMVELGVVEGPPTSIPTVESAVRPLTHADLLSAELAQATPSRADIDLLPDRSLVRETKRAG